MPEILIIQPVGTNAFVRPTEEGLSRVKNEDTRLCSAFLPDGPTHLTYRSYEALIVPRVLELVRRARKQYDAAVISCFYDPGLYAAREIAGDLVVSAPCEACCHIAATLGHKFSVLTNDAKCIPQMEQTIVGYGFGGKLASLRSLGSSVYGLHQDEALTARRMEEQARRALEQDGAEVIVLGCTVQMGFSERLRQTLGVPVIDAETAALKYAEFLVGLRDRCGWTPSRAGSFAPPPPKELAAFGLPDAGR